MMQLTEHLLYKHEGLVLRAMYIQTQNVHLPIALK